LQIAEALPPSPELRRAIDRVAGLPELELAELRSKSIAQAGQFSFETYCSRLNDVYSSL